MFQSKKLHLVLLLIGLNIVSIFSQSSTENQIFDFTNFYQNGVEYFEKQEYSVALNQLQQADIINPNNYNLATYLGNTCKELNLYASAIGYFDNALNINNDYLSLGNLATVYKELGRYDLALEYLDKSLSENSSYGCALINKSDILIKRGKYDEALAILNNAIDTDPTSPQAFLYIGEVYKQMGQSENALLYFDKALALDSTYSKSLLLKANVLKELGKPIKDYKSLCDTIISIESDMLSKNPQNYKYLFYRASAYQLIDKKQLMTEDLNKAIAILNNLTPLYPDASALFSWRAKMYVLLGNTDFAAEDYRKVLQLEPQNVIAKKYFEKNQ